MIPKIIVVISIVLFGFSCAKKRSANSQSMQESIAMEKGFFDQKNHWLYKVTVVKTSQSPGFAFIGLQSRLNLGHFLFDEDRLHFVSSNGSLDDSNKPSHLLNSWPLYTSDQRSDTNDRNKENNETIENESMFSIDWHSANIEETQNFRSDIDMSCYEAINTRLEHGSLETSFEHISFTLIVDYRTRKSCPSTIKGYIGEQPYTVHYRYSFMPNINSNFSPYVYTGSNDPLFKKFGFYTKTVGPNKHTSDQSRIIMNRWDPKKKHKFYFDEGFPERFKWIYSDPKKGIFALTNKLFSDHNLDISFTIEDYDEEKEFGDIRYSFIKLITNPNENGPLGYASFDSHPLTGEIFAANTVLSTARLQAYLDLIEDGQNKEYLNEEHSPITRNIKDFSTNYPDLLTDNNSITESKSLASVFRRLLPRFTYALSADLVNNGEDNLSSFSSSRIIESMKLVNPIYRPLSLGIDNGFTEIQRKLIMQSRSNHAHRLSDSIYRLEEAALPSYEDDSFEGKSKKDLEALIIYGIAIHKFGHNLGLKHNFYGSVDGALETVIVNTKADLPSTSVMDYLNFKQIIDLGFGWQPYDENAILYAYSDGKIKHKTYGLNTYAYCSDEHLELNPMCNKYDSGAAPSEILLSMIENYESGYWNKNFKVINSDLNASDYIQDTFEKMLNIKRFLSLYLDSFQYEKISKELSLISTPTVAQTIAAHIKKDLGKAATLSALFFNSVLRLNSIERPYANIVDEFTGNLKYFGIFPDKFYAQMFLLGDDRFPYELNPENRDNSYLHLLSDPIFSVAMEKIIRQSYVLSLPASPELSQIGRRLYAFNANHFFSESFSSIQKNKNKVLCYSKTSFKTYFDIDPDDIDGSGKKIIVGVYDTSSSDERLSNDSSFAIAKIDQNYYVSALNYNSYAAEVIKSGDLSAIKSMHKDYYDALEAPSECYSK